MIEATDDNVLSMAIALIAAKYDIIFRQAAEIMKNLPESERVQVRLMATAAIEHFDYLPTEVAKRRAEVVEMQHSGGWMR